VRANVKPLFVACCTMIVAVVFNRVCTYIIGYTPPFMVNRYYPAPGEVLVTAGLVSTLILIYRFVVVYVPILPREHEEHHSTAMEPVPVPAAPAESGGGN
jgi:Ni/Fe-hydrogenase subunit HybB-like protein